MSTFFHVSAVANRASITEHGLDWSRMGRARGIAGSRQPEVDGVFVARDEDEADYFVMLNNTGGPVDVWEVRGLRRAELVDNGAGYDFVPRRVPAADVTLLRTDLEPQPFPDETDGGAAYWSRLTIAFDDPPGTPSHQPSSGQA